MENSLEFSGNWYFDLGRLGLINLFEEVFDYNLNKVAELLKDKEKLKIYFTFAFLFKEVKVKITQEEYWGGKYGKEYQNLKKALSDLKKKTEKDKRKELEECKEKINKKIQSELDNLKSNYLNNKLQNNLWKEFYDFCYSRNLKDYLKRQNRVPIDSSFYKNFLFFNPSSKLEKQSVDFNNFIDNKYDKISHNLFDKAINKLMPSYDEFSNIYFCKIRLQDIQSTLNFNLFPILILCLPYAFYNISGKNYCLYSPDLKFTYSVNKKIKNFLNQMKDQKEDILKITWEKIVDTLTEYKSIWALNNMYLISYQIKKQEIVDAEYIGIDKLKAKIILDDTIRQNLNNFISISKGKNTSRIWVLNEFIKGSILLDKILEYLKSQKDKVFFNQIFYALSTEAIIIELSGENNIINGFSTDSILSNHKILNILPDRVKDNQKIMIQKNNFLKEICKSISDRQFYYAIKLIETKQKDKFLNFILKKINSTNGFGVKNWKKEALIDFILQKILYNENTWQYYAAALLV